jgi:hypothetical protein
MGNVRGNKDNFKACPKVRKTKNKSNIKTTTDLPLEISFVPAFFKLELNS